MRALRLLVLGLGLLCTSNMCGLAPLQVQGYAVTNAGPLANSSMKTFAAATQPARVDFATQVKPIMQGRCQPCHFQGGTMYQKLPFDRPETIKTLGERLFTRLKEENDRRVIRDFLSQ